MITSNYPDKDIDFPTIANSYVYCISGALLTLGFKYLGTSNSEIAKLIIEEILIARELKTQVIGGPLDTTDQNKNYIEKQNLLTILCVGCISLGLIMAGTGDVESFRIMKRIRKKVEGEYGFSMAIHMAIGFLFLGNCQYSFSSTDFSIAVLLAAVYPKFPSTPSDNRYHLQAFRHLYILSLEKRLLVTKDAESKKYVNAPLKVEYSDIGFVHYTSPVLLRPLHLCKSIEIIGEEYYNYTFTINTTPRLVLFTKKKIESSDNIARWDWIKTLNYITEEELEPWVGNSDSPAMFYKTYKEIIPKIFEKTKRLAKEEKSWLTIFNAYHENKQEIIPYILSLFNNKQDLECVKIFYTKLHSKPSQRSLISLKDLYQLYKNDE